MLITRADKVNSENLVRILRRVKIELSGAEEILGTAEVLKWMSGLVARIDNEIKAQEDATKAQAAVAMATQAETLMPAKKKRAKKGE